MATSTLQTLTTAYTPRAELLAQQAGDVYLNYLGLFEVLGILVTIGFVIGIVSLNKKTNWLNYHVDRFRSMILTTNLSKEKAARSWSEIQKHFFAGSENDLKVAIIDADKMLDEALRNAGVIGSNLGDRLKKIKSAQLPNIEEVWQAHKLRNQIAHDDGTSFKRDIAEKALGIYETALKSLGALDTEKKKEEIKASDVPQH